MNATRLWRDVLIVSLLAAGAGAASWQGAQRISPVIIESPNSKVHSVWFEADLPHFFTDMSTRQANHGATTAVHPLFPLLTYPAVMAVRLALGLSPLAAVRVVLATVAALWLSLFFLLLRLLGCRRLDAALFSLLAASSASAMFWFVVPESYPFGSLTVLLALVTVAVAQERTLPSAWYVLLSASTLGITLTNWMAGVLATFASVSWRRALRLTAGALCLVVALSWAQRLIFPGAQLFPLGNPKKARFILSSDSGSAASHLNAFVFHSMAMPGFETVDRYRAKRTGFPIMTTQSSQPGSGSRWGAIAVWLWAALLSLGIWGACSEKKHPRLRAALALLLLGQLLLHLLYGEETFLYSLHFAPLLVALAAFSTLTRARWGALALAGALAVCIGINNALQFQQAVGFVEQLGASNPPHLMVQAP